MKLGIALLTIFLTACAATPKHEAWRLAMETPNPPGSPEWATRWNCVPVAFSLQEKYGGRVARLVHPRIQYGHAVLVTPEDTILDNGQLGYETSWTEVRAAGWKFDRWMK